MRVQLTTVGLPLERARAEKEANAQEQGRSRQMELPEGTTVEGLLAQLDGVAERVQKVLVNGTDAARDWVLKDGDAVSLVGPTSGI